MKNLLLYKLLQVVLIFVVMITTAQSCNAIKQWFGNRGNFDKKQVRENRKALREQMEEDEFWSGDDEYNFWEENEDYDRDRW